LSWMDQDIPIGTEGRRVEFNLKLPSAGRATQGWRQDRPVGRLRRGVQHQAQRMPWASLPACSPARNHRKRCSRGGRSLTYGVTLASQHLAVIVLSYNATPIAQRESQHSQDKMIGRGHVALQKRSPLSRLTLENCLAGPSCQERKSPCSRGIPPTTQSTS
jgi:hypothetical protein